MSKKSKSAKITRISAQPRSSQKNQQGNNSQLEPKANLEQNQKPTPQTNTDPADSKATEAKIINPTTELNDKVVADHDDPADAKTSTTEVSKTANDQKSQANKLDKTNESTKKSEDTKSEKPLKEVFILARPFVALGRYLRDSWRELRQVRWPNRKATWKMTLAVLAYCAAFILLVTLLDIFFTFIFKLILGQ